MWLYDTNPKSLGSGRINPNLKLLLRLTVGLPEFPKTEGCHSECLEYFMTWSIWVGSSIWIKFRKLDVSIQMYTTNKKNIDYQLTKMRKYLTNHPPQKDQRHLQQPKSSTTISSPPSPNKNPEKKVTIFFGFECGFPEAPSRNHFAWIPVSAKLQLWWNQCVGSWTSGFHPPLRNQGLEK